MGMDILEENVAQNTVEINRKPLLNFFGPVEGIRCYKYREVFGYTAGV